ncbi:MAG: MATE family efflux transporter [Gammaproteobacteria bacterium]|nr:MATE family efflux transporter [Gammaproteobacteria bacterium]MCP4091712.1 MATE family efflux transporter [Gammaproteobacteria bacterium]MCP4275019.1 MATE family efflux transporter [Gammaproteobacteria bacterium]MCP4831842.1 MATE family efflux transporter [Gammaproteobacteria bacterium]MCP4929778.1 MATE family efflux transporter [Gammaproteobacteria bacterium]
MHDGYSHKAIWKIAGPMILSSISTPLVGLVDTALMGHLDTPAYLGAVAAGTTIFSVLFMSLNFLRMGTTGIAAQAFGSGNTTAILNSLTQALVIAALIALALITLQLPVIDISLWLLGLQSETANMTYEYFTIRVWSAPAAMANFVIIGWLLGMQNARGPLAIMLTINLSNLILDIVFVVGMGLNVRGVALATLIAEVLGLIVALSFARSVLQIQSPSWHQPSLFKFSSYKHLLTINSDLFIRSVALMFTFAFITAQGARLGAVVLAANALLMNFQLFLSYALDGIAHASEALTGKAVGSGNHEGLDLAVKRSFFWTLILALLFTLTYIIFGNTIINLLTDLTDVRGQASDYLPWLVTLPLLSAAAFLYDGVYVGATRSREMRIIMTGALLLVFLPIWFTTKGLGNHGLWLAFTAFMASRSLAMYIWYQHLRATNRLFT